MERRQFLVRTTLAGSALLGLGALGIGLRRGRTIASSDPLAFFSRPEFSTLHQIADALLPESRAFPDAPLRCATGIDQLMGRCEPDRVGDLRLLMRFLENGLSTLLHGSGIRPFSRLDRESAREVLESWRTHRVLLLRTGYTSVSRLVYAHYYDDPRTWPGAGYPGPPDLSALDLPEPL